MKAEAIGIVENEDVTVVAVKMVKGELVSFHCLNNTDFMYTYH